MPEEYLCIVCPLGCRLQVTCQDGACRVSGAHCKQGRVYGEQEATAPVRILTTTLATTWKQPLPVRSAVPIAKTSLLAVQRHLAGVIIDRPVAAGDVVLADIDGRGTALVATAAGAPPAESASSHRS